MIRRGAGGARGARRTPARTTGTADARGRARARDAARSASTAARCARASTTAGSRWSSTRPTGCAWCTASMRDRRQFLDRSAAALWPSYRGDAARVRARARASETRRSRRGARDEEAWTERFVACGARLRHRRAAYAARLTRGARARASGPRARATRCASCPAPRRSEPDAQAALAEELRRRAPRERAAGRSLAGPAPRRGRAAARRPGRRRRAPRPARPAACCWRWRSRACGCYREETGRAAVALLDDLDSELDEERAGALCAEVARRGQALVTTRAPGLGGEPAAVGADLPRLGRRGALRLTPSETKRET